MTLLRKPVGLSSDVWHTHVIHFSRKATDDWTCQPTFYCPDIDLAV